MPLKLKDLFSLEHSQNSEDKGLFPWHLGPLTDALTRNQQDCLYNNRKENKWQMICIGTYDKCYQTMQNLMERKKADK